MRWPPERYGEATRPRKPRDLTRKLSATDLARLLHTTDRTNRMWPARVSAYLTRLAWEGEGTAQACESLVEPMVSREIANRVERARRWPWDGHASGSRARLRTALGAISKRVLGRYVQPGEVVRGRPYPPWSELRKLIGE